jgi:hypothetical protein
VPKQWASTLHGRNVSRSPNAALGAVRDQGSDPGIIGYYRINGRAPPAAGTRSGGRIETGWATITSKMKRAHRFQYRDSLANSALRLTGRLSEIFSTACADRKVVTSSS